jgi:ADP-ribose pyrophosphatase YjhB (NUDIX family)
LLGEMSKKIRSTTVSRGTNIKLNLFMKENLPPPQFIRPIVICLFSHDDKILVCEGIDSVKNETFYRPAGGMIEFQEKAEDALRREIKEETGEKITNIKYLATIENIFTYEGKNGHEIILVYDAEFVNKDMYKKDVIDITELNCGWCYAYWKNLDEFGDGKLKLYPDELPDLLKIRKS